MQFPGKGRWFEDLLRRLPADESVLIAVGIGAFLVGVLVDIFLLRLICLIVVLGTAGLLFASVRVRHLGIQSGRTHSSPSLSQQEGSLMKKLVFDDFQPSTDGAYRVGQVEDDAPAGNHGVPAQAVTPKAAVPSPVTPYVPIAPPPPAVITHEFNIADFFDIDSEIFRGDAEPRTEFDFLLNKVLAVIKEVLFAHTVAFFWANRDKQQMVLEARLTDSAQFIPNRRFKIGHDLVSKVAQTGKPEFISELNPTSLPELLCYYETPEAVRSFIGVPVFFSRGNVDQTVEQPVAVIAVDCLSEDEFGPETLSLLGRFTKLVSALIKSYNDKYDLLLDAELLHSIRRFQERVRSSFSMSTIVLSLAEETSRLVNWDFLSIVLYDEVKHAWIAKKVVARAHEGYITTDQLIDFPGSIVGQTIRQNTHRLVDDMTAETVERYYKGETITPSGSFLSVPISSLNKCYGAISIESRERYNFSRHDVEILYRLAENAASALEIFTMQEVIHEYVIIDDVTGVYSKKFFVQRVEEELQRADDAGNELSLLFLTIDKAAEVVQRYGPEGFERVVATLAKAVRTCVRPYDCVGRYDQDRLGVLLINTPANDAYLWAEKIRKNIAGLVINLEGKSFSITISIGVCGVLDGMKKEELLGNTVTVLNKAAEAGGNVVRVY
jgi:diguanylate cyclase (GGDEF)-like protein